MDKDLASQLAEEAASAARTPPSDAKMTSLRKKATELLEAEREVTETEKKLSEAKEKLNRLRHVEMPDLMQQIGQDTMGMPDWGAAGADLELLPYYSANISAEWPPEKRAAAFEHLDALGASDLVKTTVTFQFNRGADALMRAFLATVGSERFQKAIDQLVRAAAPDVNDTRVPEPSVARMVPWQTLTAFVREWYEKPGEGERPPLVLAKIGATVGSVVKIKLRKEKK